MIVFITGTESTGKTELARKLSNHFGVSCVQEYARGYIESLDKDYTINDVEEIARHQIQEIISHKDEKLIFFDTGLIITMVWFDKKYNFVPDWFKDIYIDFSKGHYLLCNPDIPWVSDPVRENPDRGDLDSVYEKEIKNLDCPYARIGGIGDMRLNNAISIVETWLEIEYNYNEGR